MKMKNNSILFMSLFIVVLILAYLSLDGCNSLSLKTHHGWLGPNVYELTDGVISINYYDGDCCCIAKAMLTEIKRRVEEDNLDWNLFKDSLYTKNYLSQLCQEMRGKQ
jgi:hypothetical protein